MDPIMIYHNRMNVPKDKHPKQVMAHGTHKHSTTVAFAAGIDIRMMDFDAASWSTLSTLFRHYSLDEQRHKGIKGRRGGCSLSLVQ